MRRPIGLNCGVHVDLYQSCLRTEDVVTCLYLNGSSYDVKKTRLENKVYRLVYVYLFRPISYRLAVYYAGVLLLLNGLVLNFFLESQNDD